MDDYTDLIDSSVSKFSPEMQEELKKIVSGIQKKVAEACRTEVDQIAKEYPVLSKSKDKIITRLENKINFLDDDEEKKEEITEEVLEYVKIDGKYHWIASNGTIYLDNGKVHGLYLDGHLSLNDTHVVTAEQNAIVTRLLQLVHNKTRARQLANGTAQLKPNDLK